MSKKLVSLVLALMLVLASAAFAMPSKTTGDLTEVTFTAPEGVDIGNFALDVKEETDFSKQVFDEFTQFLADDSKAIVDYFPEEVMNDIVALLPEGVAASDLTVNEFMPLTMSGYDVAIGDMKIGFNFPTLYQPGQSLIAVVGIQGDTAIEWVVLEGAVTPANTVEVTFTADVLQVLSSENAVLAILS